MVVVKTMDQELRGTNPSERGLGRPIENMRDFYHLGTIQESESITPSGRASTMLLGFKAHSLCYGNTDSSSISKTKRNNRL